MSYQAIFQHYRGAWFGHVPDMPNILVSAEKQSDAEQLLREAVELRLAECAAEGLAAPACETDELVLGQVSV